MRVLRWCVALPFLTVSAAQADSDEAPSEIVAAWNGEVLYLTAGERDAWVSLTFRLKHGARLDTDWTHETVFVSAQESILVVPVWPRIELPNGAGAWPGTVTGHMIAKDDAGNWLQTAQPLPRALFTVTTEGEVNLSTAPLETLLPHTIAVEEGEILATVSTSAEVAQ